MLRVVTRRQSRQLFRQQRLPFGASAQRGPEEEEDKHNGSQPGPSNRDREPALPPGIASHTAILTGSQFMVGRSLAHHLISAETFQRFFRAHIISAETFQRVFRATLPLS